MRRSRAYDLLERISTLLRGETRTAAHREGLQPVQLEVLDYLARCNRYSDTPAGVVDFLGLTKGTVSQSILRLEEKGFLEREPDAADRRLSHLRLTASGRRVTKAAWRRRLEAAIEDASSTALRAELEAVLRALQSANANRSFGVCRSCRFFERRGEKAYRCGLTLERLSVRDSELLCREHEVSAVSANG